MNKTRDVAEMGREVAEDTMSDLKEKYNQGKEAAKRYAAEAGEAASEYARQAKDATETQIKENPFWSMLIAVGIGAGLGFACGMLCSSGRDE